MQVDQPDEGRVHDLPKVRVRVVEHEAQQRACACGQVTTASFPTGVSAPAVYGAGVRAPGTYLLVGQHLPVERTAELLGEVLGVPVATGTLAGWTGEAAEHLEGFGAVVGSRLPPAGGGRAEHTSAARAAGQTALEPGLVAGIQGCYTRLIELGCTPTPPPGCPRPSAAASSGPHRSTCWPG